MSLADETDLPAAVVCDLPESPIITRLRAQLERCKEWIEPSLEDSFYTWTDVESAVLESRAILVPGNKSAMVTEDQDYPTGKVMQVWVAGGDMDELVAMAPGVEALARLRGCTSVTVEGRKGWERVLRSAGYEPWSITLRKAL